MLPGDHILHGLNSLFLSPTLSVSQTLRISICLSTFLQTFSEDLLCAEPYTFPSPLHVHFSILLATTFHPSLSFSHSDLFLFASLYLLYHSFHLYLSQSPFLFPLLSVCLFPASASISALGSFKLKPSYLFSSSFLFPSFPSCSFLFLWCCGWTPGPYTVSLPLPCLLSVSSLLLLCLGVHTPLSPPPPFPPSLGAQPTYRNRSWPAVSQICSFTVFPPTLTTRDPNSTPIVWLESCLTGNGKERGGMQRLRGSFILQGLLSLQTHSHCWGDCEPSKEHTPRQGPEASNGVVSMASCAQPISCPPTHSSVLQRPLSETHTYSQ